VLCSVSTDEGEKVTRELFCKIENAIHTLKQYEPPEGYYVAFSGGKDSVVILDLVRKAKVKHDTHFHKTSIDAIAPKELIRREFLMYSDGAIQKE
jgi:3'-phosphoadenosine 5'-phosphosulfate sulfotransferase (PAPS reductase)/FAD synthetase